MSDEDDDEGNKKGRAALQAISSIVKEYPAHAAHNLCAACYTFSELGLFPGDIAIKDEDDAIRIWALIEYVRRNGWPDNLRM